MGRLVTARISKSDINFDDGEPADPPDDYLDRVAKYIPAETLTAYVAIQSFVERPEAGPPFWWIIVFLILLIGTPLYIRLRRKEGQVWKLHALIGTLGFLIWSYALHDNDKFSPWGDGILNIPHDAIFAGVLLIIFPFITGLFIPRKPALLTKKSMAVIGNTEGLVPEVLAKLSSLSARLNKDVEVTSGKRSGLPSKSAHNSGIAVDIKIEGLTSVAIAAELVKEGFSGIGEYYKSNGSEDSFAHGDIRGLPGSEQSEAYAPGGAKSAKLCWYRDGPEVSTNYHYGSCKSGNNC